MSKIKIKTALISVYHKTNLGEIISILHKQGVTILSTGGTKAFIENQGVPVTAVEELTTYPSIFGGRVKTLHPVIFGGILYRRDNKGDKQEAAKYNIPGIDLVIVDLYPFEETVASGAGEQDIIEKIDIGGITLIRAAAKNFKAVVIIPSQKYYPVLLQILSEQKGETEIGQRRTLATEAFNISSNYDVAIYNYFSQEEEKPAFKNSILQSQILRYGENPHQKGIFYGDFDKAFTKIQGKEISYNNLLDIEAAVYLLRDFNDTTFAILKHNNACGVASRSSLIDAWNDALAGDPVSAFGGILITNIQVDKTTAEEIHKLFFEVIIAPSYSDDALEVLVQKKNRIILIDNACEYPTIQFRTLLNGVLLQDRDIKTETQQDMKPATKKSPSAQEYNDLVFANKVVKHSKSNTIVLAKNNQLLAGGVGQTSRVDALNQAIEKAGKFGFDLKGAVMASDAFFPFPDCVEMADKAGITSVIQPGGSIRDQDSIDYCNKHNMSMVFTGTRHFKH